MGLCSHVIELCLLSQPMLRHKIAWNLLLKLWGNRSHTIQLHRQHNSLPSIEQKCVCVRECLCFQCFWDTRIITSKHAFIHTGERVHAQWSQHQWNVSTEIHTQLPKDKLLISHFHVLGTGICAISCAFCCQSYGAIVNGCPGWHRGRGVKGEERRGGRKGRERRGAEKRTAVRWRMAPWAAVDEKKQFPSGCMFNTDTWGRHTNMQRTL